MKNVENWDNFVVECTKNILPIYEKHEQTFDSVGIHSQLHIARSLIFAEFMTRFKCIISNINPDFTAIRYAVAFHDSGRQANGIDYWESDSAKLCYLYLSDKEQFTLNYCKYVASLIIKDEKSDNNKIIVTDSDVLEIMRPCCGHGERDGFRPNFLNFLKSNSDYKIIRNDLIEDAWKLIEYTEDNNLSFKNNNHLYELMDIIDRNKNRFRVLRFN